MSERSFVGYVALVTGGTGGMAPAIGAELARRGVSTVVFAQRGEAAAACAACVAANPACAAVSMALDLSSRASVRAFVDSLAARVGGRLDFLVNCSGACPRTAVDDVGEDEMASTLAVNATGPFWLAQACRPLMWAAAAERARADPGGPLGGGDAAVLNIGSLAGEDGAFAASIAYTMAKAALRGMTMQLAKNGFPPEAAAAGAGAPRSAFPLIRCNAIAPGPVRTAMLDDMAPADLAKITSATLTDRITTVHEVARAAAYLLLDATNVTGQTLQLSGGVIRR
jgi:short-subunit dehydrogenase